MNSANPNTNPNPNLASGPRIWRETHYFPVSNPEYIRFLRLHLYQINRKNTFFPSPVLPIDLPFPFTISVTVSIDYPFVLDNVMKNPWFWSILDPHLICSLTVSHIWGRHCSIICREHHFIEFIWKIWRISVDTRIDLCCYGVYFTIFNWAAQRTDWSR